MWKMATPKSPKIIFVCPSAFLNNYKFAIVLNEKKKLKFHYSHNSTDKVQKPVQFQDSESPQEVKQFDS
jgi:hypothetical protein